MMETERRGHQKHRCKHCGKSFPSGRSLGGHMRCHAPPAAPVTTSPASEPDDKPQSGRSLVGGFSPAYGLRQNPKKTWRMSADDVPAHGGGDGKSCRECGKRFASWKSLFGHMRSHSLKQLSTIEQEEEEEEEEQQQQQEQEQEQEQQSKAEEEEEEEASRSRSDTVFGNVHVPRKRRRSRRAIASCSVSASEEYEKEDEEGAITLLMLSRDVRCWISGGLIHCVQESSDKNSAVVENKRVDLASDEGEETKKAKRRRRSQLDDLRNGRRSRGIKKVEESDASADNGLIGDHGFEQFDDSRKDPSSNSASEFWIKGEGSELEASLHGASNGDFDDGILAEKRRRKSRSFECADCDKAFHSYQALGGHRASHHKRIDQKADLIARRGGSGKKAADHECLICGRSFASGQALGGHKKSHLGLIQHQKLPEKPDELLDLNIPASTTEGDCVSTNNGSILSSIYGGLAEPACSMSH